MEASGLRFQRDITDAIAQHRSDSRLFSRSADTFAPLTEQVFFNFNLILNLFPFGPTGMVRHWRANIPSEKPPSLTEQSEPEEVASQKGIPSTFRMLIRQRFLLVGGGLIGMTLLLTSFRLSPDPKGLGTHRQLGFPQCTFIEFFQIPCPTCGMTTSWSYLTKGRIIQAFRVNSGGTMLGILTMVTAPWLLVSGLRGFWWPGKPEMVSVFFITLAIAVVTIAQWLIRIDFFPL